MRKIMIVVLGSLLAVASTVGVYAAPNKAQTPNKAPTANKTETAVGEISTVNAQSMTFSVKTKDQTESFTLSKDASLTSLGKPIHLADLKVGERVEVKYMFYGASRKASSVHVVGQPAKAS